MKLTSTIANFLWVASNVAGFARYREALHRPAEAQWALLRRTLAHNADCGYGRAHALSKIRSYSEFARRVPLIDYANLEPWIERIKVGQARVLTSEQVTHLVPTSGSAGGRKLIPFTAGLQREFDRAIAPWIVDLTGQRPGILFGPAYWSISPAMEPTAGEASAVPIGFADDASYLGGVKGWLARRTIVGSPELGHSSCLEEFQYQTLLCLLKQRELRMISIWHPSFLTLLLRALPGFWKQIVGEIWKVQPDRARELEQGGPYCPQCLWPRLQVISCWGDGAAEIAIEQLRGEFPGALVQAKGLLATEAFVTIPFGGLHPVAIRSHFFEFLDEGGRLRLVHELRERETYEIIVTTAGGLWRYRLGDRVRVTGFVEETPSLEFLGRSGNVSDLFGEKLSEGFVAKAIRETLTSCQTSPRFVLLAPDEDAGGCRYTLYIEGAGTGRMAEGLEAALQRNSHYAYCRHLGQLRAVRVFVIAERGYETYAARQMAQGVRLGNIKPALLSRTPGWSQLFSGGYAPELTISHQE